MSDLAIRVENLGKRYRIGHLQQRHDTLRDALAGAFKRPALSFSKGSSVPTPSRSDFPTFQRSNGNDLIWALKDVSFEVKRGEVVGIIGRNGAGKSTLLKILSRITEPTEGWADIYGRVGTLLEVGTGFHPELTGRENIYLSGAILGMKRKEIERKFDEIVAFAEIEQFIDTPVKRFSSGMYIRLAFAVAAHLEPEILMVDEVLAVGDAAFQKKCLGKMGDVAKEGRTVLFVSHNMAAIKSLCERGIVLNQGRVVTLGPIGNAIYSYQDQLRHTETQSVGNTRGINVLGTRISSGSGRSKFLAGDELLVEMDFFSEFELLSCLLNLVIEDGEGRYIIHSRTDQLDLKPTFSSGIHHVGVRIPRLSLRAGIYSVWFRIYINSNHPTMVADSDRIMLNVEGPQVTGLVDLPCFWSFEPSDN